jgi:DNA-binding LytR/AlgR family response regulator
MTKKKKKKQHRGWIIFPGYIPGYEKNVIKRPSTIAWVEADDHYIYIYFKNGNKMTQAVCLKYMEERLNMEVFFRVNNSFIINMKFVNSYYKKGRDLMIMLKNLPGETNGKEITVSKLLIEDFEEMKKRFPAIMRGSKQKM